MPGKMIIWCQFYSEILWKSVHVIPRIEVAEYRHLRKGQYLKDNVLTSIITPPQKKILRPSLLKTHMWVGERSSKCAYNNEDTFAHWFKCLIEQWKPHRSILKFSSQHCANVYVVSWIHVPKTDMLEGEVIWDRKLPWPKWLSLPTMQQNI